MSAARALAFLFCLIAFQDRSGATSNSKTQLFNSLLENYDKSEAPNQGTGKPTDVKVEMYIISIELLSENDIDMSFTAYLRLRWTDPRLNFSSPSGKPKMHLPEDSWNKIWIPDIFVMNAKRAKFHDMVTPNRFLRLYTNGSILYSMKVSYVTSCVTKYNSYPFDTIKCPIHYESYGNTAKSLIVSGTENPLDLNSKMRFSGYTLLQYNTKDSIVNYTSGTYSFLKMSLLFKREASHFIYQICIPSIFIVILSWISFWVDRDATVARLMTGLISLIALTLLSIKEPHDITRTSGANLLDVWLLVCYGFVFATILEYVLVIVLSRRRDGTSGLHNLKPFGHKELGSDNEKPKETDEGKRRAVWIDWGSRILFPFAFLIFILFFWVKS